MGIDSRKDAEALQNPRSFKVHGRMCMELNKILDRVLRIFPAIEEARPRSSSGIETLCLLNNAIDRSKLVLQHCSESSKLYLACTGNAVLARCQKARKLLEKSLIQIQGMVPVMLAAEVSGIIDDLECVKLVLESTEEEAGRVMNELLVPSSSASDSLEDDAEVKALKFAAPRLNITSAKAIVTEQRDIKKLLDKVGPNDQKKKKILGYFYYLLRKHGSLIIGEQMELVLSRNEEQIATENSNHDSLQNHQIESDPCLNYGHYRTQINDLGRVTPPDEYKCPISSRLMYDPVVIASGVTYERMWIQKWFDEGNDLCPKTRKKLAHMGLTPNIAMKDLISKWCKNTGVSISDPRRTAQDFHSLQASSTSIKSFASYINDFTLPLDISNISLGSLDTSYNSDASHGKTTRTSNLMPRTRRTSDDSQKHEAHEQVLDADLMLLSKLHDLQWHSQCQIIEDLKNNLNRNYRGFGSVSPENVIKPLVGFLNSAYDRHDIKALRSGTQLLLEFVNNCRNGLVDFSEDIFTMLASFLDSEVIGEALAVMEELSGYRKAKIAGSSALPSVLSILDSDNKEFQRQAIVILYNLSFNGEVFPHMLHLKCIPKLLPLFKDRALLRYCVCILKNLCDTAEGRNSVAETKGCISSVAEILDAGSSEEQEHALAVLVSLCSQSVDYCQLVIKENVILPLAFISKNGSDKAQASAFEMLRLLRDADHVEDEVSFEPNVITSQTSNNQPQEKKSSRGLTFLKKLSPFSKSKR